MSTILRRAFVVDASPTLATGVPGFESDTTISIQSVPPTNNSIAELLNLPRGSIWEYRVLWINGERAAIFWDAVYGEEIRRTFVTDRGLLRVPANFVIIWEGTTGQNLVACIRERLG